MVRLERFGGATGIVAVAAIATQFALVGTAGTDAQSLLRARARWELATFMRVVGGLGIMWFTTGFAARLRRFGFGPAGPSTFVLGAGVLWGAMWLLSAVFNSAAITEAVRGDGEWSVRWLSILGSQTVLVLTPTLMITFLIATGVAVLASPTFPRRFGHAALFFALVRTGLALVDWYGGADVAMRIMDMTLIWVVIASVHLMGATRPVQA
ncbi:MAG TPA: hypothetical protein VL919_13050 [Vicinamibacterales bacterium]|nr:hypothetical protein [Vicinamibacterales bacterium]